jgi:hypothetical protein
MLPLPVNAHENAPGRTRDDLERPIRLTLRATLRAIPEQNILKSAENGSLTEDRP